MFSKFKVENEHLLFKLQKKILVCPESKLLEMSKKKMLWKYSAFMVFMMCLVTKLLPQDICHLRF